MAYAQKPANLSGFLAPGSVINHQLPEPQNIDYAGQQTFIFLQYYLLWDLHSYMYNCYYCQQLLSTQAKLLAKNILAGSGVDTWDSLHRSISAFGSAKDYSSQCNTNRTNRTHRQRMIDELNMIPAEDHAERIRMWVDYGTYGFARLGDVTPWVHLKHSMGNNRTQPDEGVSKLLERIDLLFITEPLTGIRTHGNYGTNARSGSNQATAPNPDRKRASSADPGGSKRRKGPNKNQEQPGGDDKSSNKLKPFPRKQGQYKCHVPNDSCKDQGFDSLDGLLQHLAGSHMEQCCPVCQDNISLIEGRWVLSPGRDIRVETDINLFFSNSANMKHHIFRVHLKPFRCPECSYGSDRNGLKRHLQSRHQTLDNPDAYLQGISNTNNPELEDVLRKFDGSHTKAKMKAFLDESNIIEKLKSSSQLRQVFMTQDQQPGSLTAVPHQSPGDFQQGTLILNNESSMCLDQNLLDCPDLDDILSCNWVSQQDLEGIYPQEIPDSSNLHYPQHTGYMCGSSNPSNHDATKNISNRNHDITKDASTAIRYRSPAHATGTSNPAGQEPVNSHADPSNSTISRQTLSPTTTVPRRPHQSITTPDFSSVSQCSSSQQSTEASQLSTSQRSTNDIETDVTVASSSAAVPSTTQTEIGANGVPICIPQNTQTLETLLHQSGIPDDEVGEIGWRVLKVLVEFVQIWEKYSAAVERMGDRAGKNMAKVLNSKELCSLNRAICIYQRSNDIGSAQDFGFAAKGTALHGQAVSASTTQETVQPANTSPSLTVPKSLETIVSHSGLTDEEVDEIGWKVLKGLAEFVHLYEKISAAVKEMNDRAKKNIAKILDSKRSHSLSIAIYNYQNSIGIGLTPNLGEV